MIRNFLFHRVSPEKDVLWPPMKPELFEKCIQYITRRYTVVKLEDLPGRKIEKNEKLATISFDDGYKDNIQFAFPILETYKVKASFYVVTDCIDNNVPTWTYIFDHLFQNTHKTQLDIQFDFLPSKLHTQELKTARAKIAYAKKLKPFLKTLEHEKRGRVLETINKAFSDVPLGGLMMSWDDLRVLDKAGHAVGSHTRTHCMLGTMQNEKEIQEELKYSADRICSQLGTFPKTISYPVGSYNETTLRLSKEAGYEIGLAVKQDVYIPKKHGIFEIPRIELYNEPWSKTKLRIDHSLELFKKMIRYK